MMKKITLLLFLLVYSFSSPVLAITLTPTATPSTTPTSEQDQAEIIRNIVQQKLSSEEAMRRAASLVGYVGKITAISSSSITLQSNGDVLQVKTSDKTTYNKSGVVKFSSLAINDKAIVIGIMDKNIIDAKRIVVIKESPSEVPSVIFGKILSSDVKTRTIIVRTKDDDQTFILSRNANLKMDKMISGKNILAVFHLQVDDQVITTAKVF